MLTDDSHNELPEIAERLSELVRQAAIKEDQARGSQARGRWQKEQLATSLLRWERESAPR